MVWLPSGLYDAMRRLFQIGGIARAEARPLQAQFTTLWIAQPKAIGRWETIYTQDLTAKIIEGLLSLIYVIT